MPEILNRGETEIYIHDNGQIDIRNFYAELFLTITPTNEVIICEYEDGEA